MSEPILSVENLMAGYEAGAPIVRDVSLTLMPGEIVALLGPNGAGKSTLIRSIAGLVQKFGGRMRFEGDDITGMQAHELARRGLGFVPQTENVFAWMTVADNLRLAADLMRKSERAVQIESVYALFPDLARQRQLAAGQLSGGQRQMLAVARALIARPRLLMLDEASAGLSPLLVQQVFAKLKEVRASGVTILLVEQNVKAALSFADRALILVEGIMAHEGPASVVARDPAIARLYFGGRAA